MLIQPGGGIKISARVENFRAKDTKFLGFFLVVFFFFGKDPHVKRGGVENHQSCEERGFMKCKNSNNPLCTPGEAWRGCAFRREVWETAPKNRGESAALLAPKQSSNSPAGSCSPYRLSLGEAERLDT